MMKITRRQILGLAAGALCSAAFGQERRGRLNVLLIMSDDLNNDMGCYGHDQVKTPNIDRLAARGVVFDHAYCQYPLCNPSRTSMMTGLYPGQTGVVSNGKHFRYTFPDLVSLPQCFRNHGYYSARVGKIYHYGVPSQIGTDGLDDPASWAEAINPIGRDKHEEHLVYNTSPGNAIGGSLSWHSSDGTDAQQTDGKVAAATIKLLEKNTDKPFFIAAGFYRPHTPFVAPHPYYDMYPIDSISLPTEPEGSRAGIPEAALQDKQGQRDMPVSILKEAKRAYYASTTFMDAQVGLLLDAMDRLALWDNTIVVFASDHGYHLGEHQLWQKRTLFENAARSPLIVAAPGMAGNGSHTGGVAELIDLYPTLTELCGLEAPGHLAGESFASLLRDPAGAGKAAAHTLNKSRNPLSEGPMKGKHVDGHTIRTARWRYTEWHDGVAGVEMYDHEKDLGEYWNLAEDPAYATEREKLRALLADARRRSLAAPVGVARRD